MAIIKNGYRPLRRDRDGVMIFLRMEDWPEDVPLPDGSEVMKTGDGAAWPNWNIIFEPDKTIEMVFGWFKVKRPLEEVFSWYATAMESRGWLEEKRHEIYPRWAYLLYRHPETEVKVEIDLRYNSHLGETRPMIRRATIHPWSPSEDEEGREAEGEAPLAAEADVPETGAPKAASLPIEELVPAG